MAIILGLALAGCGGEVAGGASDGESDAQSQSGLLTGSGAVGKDATVTASALNLRSGPSTDHTILAVMPEGATVHVLDVSNGWYKVTWQGKTGWCSGLYLAAEGGGGSSGGSTEIDKAIGRAQSGVGFSYHWGAGCWDPASKAHGACYGSCPSCTHSGEWGADCSGYVAKIWQVPGASATTSCQHPYSTYNFYNERTHWAPISRGNLKRGDALVHNSGGSGHIFLYESGDAWGWISAYEAKGCSYGIQHDSRTGSSAYIAIRRDGY